MTESEKAIIALAQQIDALLKYAATINLEAEVLPVDLIVWYHGLEDRLQVVSKSISGFTTPANELLQKIKGKLLE